LIIDFHTHAFPDAVAARAMPQMAARAGVPAYYDGTTAGLLASMQRHGIDYSVLQPVATKPEQVDGINEWCVSLRSLDGILSFGALHPDSGPEAWERQVEYLRREGFRGVKLHPDYQRFHPDEDRLEPLYARLEQADLAVLFHAGIDLGLFPPVMCTPAQIAQVQKAFPKLRIIAAHMGGFRMWADVESHLVGTPVIFDTAYCAHDLPQELFRDLVQAHGASRVVFASDGPWGDQARELAYVRGSGLTPEEVRAIEGENARKLLGI
jgi:uncharacterized protein